VLVPVDPGRQTDTNGYLNRKRRTHGLIHRHVIVITTLVEVRMQQLQQQRGWFRASHLLMSLSWIEKRRRKQIPANMRGP